MAMKSERYVVMSSNVGVTGSDHGCVGQNHIAQTLYEKCRVMWMQLLIEPPSLKIHTYFDIRHLHSAWIVQAVSFIGR